MPHRLCVILKRQPELAVLGGVVILMLVFALLTQTKWWYMNYRGADPLIARNERKTQAWDIWKRIDDYFSVEGEYPTSDRDLVRFDPSSKELFNAPRWSINTYSIDYQALGIDARLTLVEDPGIDWPGDPAECGQTPPNMDKWRVWLFNDGSISIGPPRDSESVLVEWE